MATSGWETLGNVLGGGIDRAGAFETGRLRTAQTESALQLARERQLSNVASEKKAKALDDAATAMAAAGIDPKQAQLLQNIALGGYGSDFSAGMTGLGKQQEMGFRDTLANPEAPLGEQFAAGQGVQGKVLPRYEVDGGVAQDLLGDEMGLFATPVGESTIRANDSLAQLRDTQRAAGGFSPSSSSSVPRDPRGNAPTGFKWNPTFDPTLPEGPGNTELVPISGGLQDPSTPRAIGTRERGMIMRVLTAAQSTARDLENIMAMPSGASTGFLGTGMGATPGASIMEATVGNLKNRIAPEEVQLYDATLSGLSTALMTLERQGLAGSDTLSGQYDRLALRVSDNVGTKMYKLSLMAQNVENGLLPHIESGYLPPDMEAYARSLVELVRQAVPFTPRDVISLQQSGNPGATIKDVSGGMGLPQTAAPVPGAARGAAPPPATPAVPAAPGDEGWIDMGNGVRVREKRTP
jgi:hypothetical protein